MSPRRATAPARDDTPALRARRDALQRSLSVPAPMHAFPGARTLAEALRMLR